MLVTQHNRCVLHGICLWADKEALPPEMYHAKPHNYLLSPTYPTYYCCINAQYELCTALQATRFEKKNAAPELRYNHHTLLQMSADN